MVEPYSCVSSILEDIGFEVTSVRAERFCKGNIFAVDDAIKRKFYGLLWFNLPTLLRGDHGANAQQIRNMMMVCARKASTLMTTARSRDVCAIISAHNVSRLWQYPSIVDLRDSGTVEDCVYAMCALGVSHSSTLRPNQRSMSSFRSHTTFQSQNLLCVCTNDIEHINDFDDPRPSFSREYLMSQVCTKLARHWLSSLQLTKGVADGPHRWRRGFRSGAADASRGEEPSQAATPAITPPTRKRTMLLQHEDSERLPLLIESDDDMSSGLLLEPDGSADRASANDRDSHRISQVEEGHVIDSPTQIQTQRRETDVRSPDLTQTSSGDAVQQSSDSFPTEAKEIAKKKKLAGHIPKKKKIAVEEHQDDLGDDLSGLGGDLEWYLNTYYVDRYEPDSSDDETLLVGMTLSYFGGEPLIHPHHQTVTSMEHMLLALGNIGPGIDICELCGGEGRTIKVAIRRQLYAGTNFDLTTGFDLGDPRCQQHVIHDLTANNVLVVVMAPSCRALGPPSNLNYQINHGAWAEAFERDRPHLEFCGRVALAQLRVGRFFFAENPWPTWLTHVHPGP